MLLLLEINNYCCRKLFQATLLFKSEDKISTFSNIQKLISKILSQKELLCVSKDEYRDRQGMMIKKIVVITEIEKSY